VGCYATCKLRCLNGFAIKVQSHVISSPRERGRVNTCIVNAWTGEDDSILAIAKRSNNLTAPKSQLISTRIPER
jgi:hypothetical protein